MDDAEGNPVRQLREHIRRQDRRLKERDALLRGVAEHISGLEAQLRQQRIEILLQDMGGSRKWARLYLMDEDRPSPEPDEYELADWIRRRELAHMVSKPLPVRLRLSPAESLAGVASENGTRAVRSAED